MSFLQSLAAAFKGADARVPLARSFASPWSFPEIHGGGGRRPYEYARSVKHAYLDNPVAQRAVRLVAEGVGEAPLREADPKLAALVRATSAGQSLLETLASQLLLHGNAYVQVIKDAAGQPVELFALRPERVSVVAGADGWPAAYAYKVGERALTIPLIDEDASPNLIHIRHFHPADDHCGAGCLAAAEQAVATHNAAAEWNRALLENAARPSGAMIYDAGDTHGLTTEQFDRLREELNRAYAGAGNAGRPMLLEGHGLRCAKVGGGTRHRVGLRGAADAARAAGRFDLRQLPRGQPRAVAADLAAACAQAARRHRRGARDLVPASRAGGRPRPGAGAGRRPRAAVGPGHRRRLPYHGGEARDAGDWWGEQTMNREDMLARLIAQAASTGGDLVTLRAIVEEASEMGAARVLVRMGLDDETAHDDLSELRELLQAWRDAKASAWKAAIAWLVRGALALVLVGIAVRLGALGMLR
jgi:hypothetical protein